VGRRLARAAGCARRRRRRAVAGAAAHTRPQLDDEGERKRLLKAGGKSGEKVLKNHVSVPGVEGSLKVTRSLGDSPFHKGDAVSCKPGVRHFDISPATRFLVIASDGIWDHLSNQQVVDIVDESVRKHGGDPQSETSAAESANEALLACIKKGQADGTMESYVDDKSIAILLLKPAEAAAP